MTQLSSFIFSSILIHHLWPLPAIVVVIPRFCCHHLQPGPADLLLMQSLHRAHGTLLGCVLGVAAGLVVEHVDIDEVPKPPKDVLESVDGGWSRGADDKQPLLEAGVSWRQWLRRRELRRAVGRVVILCPYSAVTSSTLLVGDTIPGGLDGSSGLRDGVSQ